MSTVAIQGRKSVVVKAVASQTRELASMGESEESKRSPIEGREGFRRILELTRPVGDSHEIWLKLGHDKFIVGDYSADGQFPIWSTSGSGKNRKRTRQHPDGWEYVSNWAKKNDGGVFFIPTQPIGYPLKEAIALSDDVAAELDEGTLEQQWSKIAEFIEISGLEPAYIIHSGSKSYHPHWKATEHLPIAQTVYLRQLVCIALNSDTAISFAASRSETANPHQPMRLAGFYRREKGREQTLEYSNDARYTYDELIAGISAYYDVKNIPFPEDISEKRWRIYKRAKREGHLDLSILTKPESELYPQSTYRANPTVPNAYRGKIPLHLALSKANQEALKGVGSERNQTGVALAKDLIGCYEWLINKNYEVEGDRDRLFIEYCQSCAPGGGWSEREWETIWRSASKGNPTPARSDLSQFIHWYRRENDPEYRQATKRQQKTNLDGEPDPKAYQEYVDWEEDSINPICKSCIFHKWKVENEKGENVAICSAQKGKGYGFRSARRVGLSHERIRASIDSLPSLEEVDYSQDIAIVDEASQIIKGSKSTRATYQDLLTKMMELEKIPEVFEALKPLRERLNPLLSGQEKLPRYGLNHERIMELLCEPIAPEILAEIIEMVAQTNPVWAQLFVTAAKHKGWGRKWFNAMGTANWYERMEAKQETMENINNLPSNFLIDLLLVWAGLIPGAIRIDRHRQLSIHTEDTTHGDKLREFKQVILLDATANKKMLCRRIGISSHAMIEIEEELPPLKNLTVINVQMSGLGSSQYSDEAITRTRANE